MKLRRSELSGQTARHAEGPDTEGPDGLFIASCGGCRHGGAGLVCSAGMTVDNQAETWPRATFNRSRGMSVPRPY